MMAKWFRTLTFGSDVEVGSLSPSSCCITSGGAPSLYHQSTVLNTEPRSHREKSYIRRIMMMYRIGEIS